jgi:hypothetical protein
MELERLLTNLVAVASIILGLGVGIWLLMSLFWIHSKRQEHELPEVDLPANIHEVFTGVPPALVVFYIFIMVTGIGYVAYIWLRGISY